VRLLAILVGASNVDNAFELLVCIEQYSGLKSAIVWFSARVEQKLEFGSFWINQREVGSKSGVQL